MKIMKRNYKVLSLLLLLAFASCSFTTKKFSNPDKDKLLVQIITFVLEQGHFDPIAMDDGFSEELFNDYIKEITKYEATADYVAISPYTLSNNGLFKNSPENVEVVGIKEVEALSNRYSSIAQTFVNRFEKWIGLNKNNIPEYKLNQDGVNAENININNGWYF